MISQELEDWFMDKNQPPQPPYERDRTTDNKQDEEATPSSATPQDPPEPVDSEQNILIIKRASDWIKEAIAEREQEEREQREQQQAAELPAAQDPDKRQKMIAIALEEMNKPPMGMFVMKTANEWIAEAKQRPVPRMLFSEFWYEGELCILFADTNTGKSILAVQIADSISRGVAVPGYKLEAEAQPVIYMDFELYDKQFEARYSINYEQHYRFAEGMHRIEIDDDMQMPDGMSFEDYIVHSLEGILAWTEIKVVVVDNITYLRNEAERAKDALPLMKQLKALKKRYNLSMLVLAHTPKRDMSKPLTRNDLSGSKMLINFCDTSFCIGESVHDKATRYLKQIKARNTEVIYDTNNVSLCRIEKPHNFLQFTHIGQAAEKEHLAERSDTDKAELIAECKRLKEEEGLSHQEIADKLGIGKSTVTKYINL